MGAYKANQASARGLFQREMEEIISGIRTAGVPEGKGTPKFINLLKDFWVPILQRDGVQTPFPPLDVYRIGFLVIAIS